MVKLVSNVDFDTRSRIRTSSFIVFNTGPFCKEVTETLRNQSKDAAVKIANKELNRKAAEAFVEYYVSMPVATSADIPQEIGKLEEQMSKMAVKLVPTKAKQPATKPNTKERQIKSKKAGKAFQATGGGHLTSDEFLKNLDMESYLKKYEMDFCSLNSTKSINIF